MALRKASEIVSEVMGDVPAPIDEEGVRIHSTDNDTPEIIVGRVTVEPVDAKFMESALVKRLGDLTKAIDKLR